MAKKYPKGVVPPCPGNPEYYVTVNRNGYFHWRRKRGTVKPATLNDSMKLRQEAMVVLSPYISALEPELGYLMKPLPVTSLHNDLFAWLQKSWIPDAVVDYRGMRGMELHRQYRFANLFQGNYNCRVRDGYVQLQVLPGPDAINKPGSLVTEFMLEAFMLYEEKKTIVVEKEASPVYSLKEGVSSECLFEFALPAVGPWMLLFKLSCFEGQQWAVHPKYYGMLVVEVGVV